VVEMMVDIPQQSKVEPSEEPKVNYVTLRKSEVIEILKMLEGLKRKLQPLLNNSK
jgi:hypothetical protein